MRPKKRPLKNFCRGTGKDIKFLRYNGMGSVRTKSISILNPSIFLVVLPALPSRLYYCP